MSGTSDEAEGLATGERLLRLDRRQSDVPWISEVYHVTRREPDVDDWMAGDDGSEAVNLSGRGFCLAQPNNPGSGRRASDDSIVGVGERCFEEGDIAVPTHHTPPADDPAGFDRTEKLALSSIVD